MSQSTNLVFNGGSIPGTRGQSDWNENNPHAASYIKNKPNIDKGRIHKIGVRSVQAGDPSPKPSTDWIIDLESPNPNEPDGYDRLTVSKAIEIHDAGEVFAFTSSVSSSDVYYESLFNSSTGYVHITLVRSGFHQRPNEISLATVDNYGDYLGVSDAFADSEYWNVELVQEGSNELNHNKIHRLRPISDEVIGETSNYDGWVLDLESQNESAPGGYDRLTPQRLKQILDNGEFLVMEVFQSGDYIPLALQALVDVQNENPLRIKVEFVRQYAYNNLLGFLRMAMYTPTGEESYIQMLGIGPNSSWYQDKEALAINGDGGYVTVDFTEAQTRTNIGTGEKLYVLFGKIKKWFTDLKALAFKDKADLTQDVNGVLPIANGGTNASTASDARTNLDVYSKAEVNNAIDTAVENIEKVIPEDTSEQNKLVNEQAIYKELHSVPNGDKPLRMPKVGDILWVDPNNGDKYFFDKSVYPVSQAVADGLESVGVVADVDGRKLLILHKDESTDLQFANCWLFKVTGIHLDGTTNTLNMQQHAANDAAVSAGTFTDSTSTTLAEFCTALDTWLREHQTVAGASETNWHCELMPDAEGVDSCFIVVDTNSYQNRLSPIASGSTATATLYMWQFAGQNTDLNSLLRNNGSNVWYAGWNKERLIEWFSNPSNDSIYPTDDPNGAGLLNKADFEGSSYPNVKAAYNNDYATYIEAMMMKWPSETGSQATFAGTGKNIGLVFGTHTHKNLAGESVYTFTANRYSYTRATESTRKSDDLGDGDWYLPDVVDSFKVLSKMKADGTDAINDSLSAISSRRPLAVSRWCCSRYIGSGSWLMGGRGCFSYTNFYNNNRCCAVALLEY